MIWKINENVIRKIVVYSKFYCRYLERVKKTENLSLDRGETPQNSGSSHGTWLVVVRGACEATNKNNCDGDMKNHKIHVWKRGAM
jgi:hypothetical protein